MSEHEHPGDCPLCKLRLTLAQALVYAYRDARREGLDPMASGFVRGILRELDTLYARSSFDPPLEGVAKRSSESALPELTPDEVDP